MAHGTVAGEEMRAPIDALLDTTEWTPVERDETTESGVPYATHSGVLEIGGSKLRCYRLNTGMAVIDADDFDAFFAGLECPGVPEAMK